MPPHSELLAYWVLQKLCHDPSVIPLVLQQVTLNPAFGRLRFCAVRCEGPLPNAPQDAAEISASVTVCKAGALHEHFARSRLPRLRAIFDQIPSS